MPNKNYYNGTLPERIAEEDREVLNTGEKVKQKIKT